MAKYTDIQPTDQGAQRDGPQLQASTVQAAVGVNALYADSPSEFNFVTLQQNLQNSLEREITTDMVGEQVMEKLREVDEVAYVRFASVYRQFKDIHTFMAELTKLLEEK